MPSVRQRSLMSTTLGGGKKSSTTRKRRTGIVHIDSSFLIGDEDQSSVSLSGLSAKSNDEKAGAQINWMSERRRYRPSSLFDQQGVGVELDFSSVKQLYGRDDQLRTLREAHQRVATEGASQVVLVSGSSGAGKSALVQCFGKEVQQQEAFFIQGKFDQTATQQAQPYSAFVHAMTELCHQVQERGLQEQFQRDVEGAIGLSSMKLLALIPALNPHLRANSDSVEDDVMVPLCGPFYFKVFANIFRRLLNGICTQTRPIIMFPDDLQWADDNSKMLFQEVANDPNSFNLLLIGAYRTGDSCDCEFVPSTDVGEAALHISRCTVEDLSVDQIQNLLTDLLGSPADENLIAGLSRLVERKTGGNCFSMIEFIKAVHQDGHCKYACHLIV